MKRWEMARCRAAFAILPCRDTSWRHPHVTIYVKLSVVADTLFRELRERSVDLVVGRNFTWGEGNDLKTESLFHETNVIVVGRHNPLARRRRVKLADLVDEPWVFPAADSVVKHIAAEMFRAAGLDLPRRCVVYASIPVIISLVANGPYLAIPPASLVRFGGSGLQLKGLPIKFPVPASPVGIITAGR